MMTEVAPSLRFALITSAAVCNMLACSADVADLGSNDSNGPIYSTGIPPAAIDAGLDSGVATSTSAGFRIVEEVQTANFCELGNSDSDYTTSFFVVDSGRLYWGAVAGNDKGETSDYLRSCDVDGCASH